MKSFEEIEVKELKAVCKSLNETGLLEKRLIYGKAKKGMDVYTDFVEAVEGLDAEHQLKLPDDVINFYNDIISDEITEVPEPAPEPEEIEEQSDPKDEEDELNGLKPLDFESDEPPESDDSYTNEEEETVRPAGNEPLDVDQLVVEPEVDDSPTLIKDPDVKSDQPVKTRTRLSKIPMNLKTEDGKITVKFPTLGIDESFELPKQGDREALKAFRKTIFAFAQEKGATTGQKQAISKELNLAGYYMRG